MYVPICDLQPGDVVLVYDDQPTVKAVQLLGDVLAIVDFEDNTSSPPLPARAGVTIERP